MAAYPPQRGQRRGMPESSTKAARADARDCPRELTSDARRPRIACVRSPLNSVSRARYARGSATVESRAEMDAAGLVLREVSPYKTDGG
jgi:hypothetical protein